MKKKNKKYFNNENKELYKDYDGDDDEDNKNENIEEFLEKAYHNYVSDMLKKEKKQKYNDFDMSEDEDENEDDNNINNYDNSNANKFEERKDQFSQEESEDGRLNTD